MLSLVLKQEKPMMSSLLRFLVLVVPIGLHGEQIANGINGRGELHYAPKNRIQKRP